MNKNEQSRLIRLSLGIAFGLAASAVTSAAQGIQASATLSGVAGAGNTYDYTLTLSDSASATSSIEGFWYAWIPGHFFLPSDPTSASGGSSGWSATPDGSSSFAIQFQGTAANAIAPGQSATFTFVSTDTPATLAGNSGSFPIGDSVAYPGTINFSSAAPNEEIAVQSVPEPTTFALLGAGTLYLTVISRRASRGQQKAG